MMDDARGALSALNVAGRGDALLSFFADGLQRPVDGLDAELIDTGVLDSLAIVDLLLFIETEFGVAVDLGALDFDDLRTVRAIAAMVDAQARV